MTTSPEAEMLTGRAAEISVSALWRKKEDVCHGEGGILIRKPSPAVQLPEQDAVLQKESKMFIDCMAGHIRLNVIRAGTSHISY